MPDIDNSAETPDLPEDPEVIAHSAEEEEEPTNCSTQCGVNW